MPATVSETATHAEHGAHKDELTDDALAGSLRVWQRRHGHRFSLDDTLTAWVAARTQPDASCALDLGCGIGSVLLMLAYKLPSARLFGLEAQTQSHQLACANIARNQLELRVSALLGDLRDEARLQLLLERNGARFPLVTGTPPYLPANDGTLPPDSQRAHARFELRGGVEAYMQAAARALQPDGVFVMCAGARADERIERGAHAAGLYVREVLPVVPSMRKGVLFSVWMLATLDGAPARPEIVRHAPFIARDEHGARTQSALDVPTFFGLPIPEHEASSPVLRARSQPAHDRAIATDTCSNHS